LVSIKNSITNLAGHFSMVEDEAGHSSTN